MVANIVLRVAQVRQIPTTLNNLPSILEVLTLHGGALLTMEQANLIFTAQTRE